MVPSCKRSRQNDEDDESDFNTFDDDGGDPYKKRRYDTEIRKLMAHFYVLLSLFVAFQTSWLYYSIVYDEAHSYDLLFKNTFISTILPDLDR